jgi:hypothetical protein
VGRYGEGRGLPRASILHATKNMAHTEFLRENMTNFGFCAQDQHSESQIFEIVCTIGKFNTFHAIR